MQEIVPEYCFVARGYFGSLRFTIGCIANGYRALAWIIHETPNSSTEPFSFSEFCERVEYRL